MSTSHPPRIRKRLLVSDSRPTHSTGALDLAASASFEYTSEDPEHCVENILDDCCGPGGTYWSGARANSIERLVIAFDAPQTLSRLIPNKGGTGKATLVSLMLYS